MSHGKSAVSEPVQMLCLPPLTASLDVIKPPHARSPRLYFVLIMLIKQELWSSSHMTIED